MPFCSFSRDAAMFDVTPVENMFLLEYLPAAPEGFVRVYLYARMLCAHPELGDGIENMAKALHMEEDAVLNAFQYWEQQGLVEKLSDRPASFAVLPLRGGIAAQTQADKDYYKYREFNSSLQELFGTELLEPRQYRLANDWLNVLGLTQDAALKILEYELRQSGGRKPASVFKRADKRAVDWAERGVRSLEDVERAIAYDDRVYSMAAAVLSQLSMNRKPTANELECVRRWIDEWHLTTEDVIAACAQTTKSRAPSIAYLDAILKSQVENGANVYFGAVKEALRELNAASATPTPEQLKAYAGYMAQGFAPETVRLAAVQCARRNWNSFEKLEWMLSSWGEAGIRSRDEAEAYIQDLQRKSEEMGALLKAAGLTRRPNKSDLNAYESWLQAHSPELILCAAELAHGTREPVKYMDKLLSNWAQAGIATPEAARAASQTAKGSAAQPSAASRVDYQQHEYTETDFDKDFYYDPSRDYPKGDDAQ